MSGHLTLRRVLRCLLQSFLSLSSFLPKKGELENWRRSFFYVSILFLFTLFFKAIYFYIPYFSLFFSFGASRLCFFFFLVIYEFHYFSILFLYGLTFGINCIHPLYHLSRTSRPFSKICLILKKFDKNAKEIKKSYIQHIIFI